MVKCLIKYGTKKVIRNSAVFLRLRILSFLMAKLFVFMAIGHLVELEEPAYYHEEWADKTRIDTLPLVPESVEYHVSNGKQKQFGTIKYLFQKADTIVWAGDIDREGCAISYLISQESGVLEDTSKTSRGSGLMN